MQYRARPSFPPLLCSLFFSLRVVPYYRGHSSPRLTKSRGTFNANAAPPKKNSKPAIWRPPPSHRFPCLGKGIHPHVGTESKRSRPLFTTILEIQQWFFCPCESMCHISECVKSNRCRTVSNETKEVSPIAKAPFPPSRKSFVRFFG